MNGKLCTIGESEILVVADTLFSNDHLTHERTITPRGQEAFHVGKQLYSDDADVQAVMDRIRIQEVANR